LYYKRKVFQFVILTLLALFQHALLPDRPIPLRSGIGLAHDATSTSSAEAQGFYDQGLAYLHSYTWIEAARSFNQALKLDPNLALAQVGLSYAYFELNDPAAARAALDGAVASDEHDVQHIEIRRAQMDAEEAPQDAEKLASYRRVLDAALVRFRFDEELWLQRGIAESSDPADRGQGATASSVRFFEEALRLAPDHFAAHHFLAHAFENTGNIQDALTHATAYATMAPSSAHARHMRGHELRRAGRIDEAVSEFEAADRLEREYLNTEAIPPAHHWHYHHNLDLLATSYQYRGQMHHAERLMKEAFAIPSPLAVQEFNKREWPAFLISRHRIDEALAAARTMIEHTSPLIRATGHIEAGRALLAAGRFQQAADEANAALRELRSAPDGAALVATSLEQLQGEFFLRTGQRNKGHELLDAVIRKLRSSTGPDQWAQALFALEAIARSARDAADWDYAMRVARQMVEHDPLYAGTHYAVALAAAREGDNKTAQSEFTLAQKYWSKADSDLAELRDIRTRNLKDK
jgi:tetratricopeptide (TPR) repeat protein